MHPALTGVAVLTALAGVISACVHLKVKRYSRAIVFSTLVTCVVFQAVVYVQLGYVEPFFLIAMATTAVVIAFVSALVGLPFYLYRKKQGKRVLQDRPDHTPPTAG